MSTVWRTPEGERAVKDAYARFREAWPVPREELRLPTRLGETFVVACGEAANPPLVLLHGAGSNSFMWLGDVARWAGAFRVYAVDLPGEPGESAATRAPRTGEAQAEWMDDVLDGMGVARAAFVGSSLGGWHILDYAIRRPQRVARMVLLAPGGLGAVRPSFLLQAMLLPVTGAAGRRRLLGALGEAPPAVAAFLELIFTHFVPRRDALPRFAVRDLARLAMPIAMFVGGRDTLLDSEGSRRRLSRAAPQARVVMLPEAGHALGGLTGPVLEALTEAVP